MTREEALNVIWLRCQHNDKTYEAYCVLKHEQQPCDDATLKDIFCMGCEYKEQQPCDKCVYSTNEGCQYDDITETIPPFEDCVSKQAVAEVLLKYAHDEVGKAFAEFLVSQINELPPVSSSEKPNKSGQWIERVERDDWDDSEEVWYECDQCHVGSERVSNYCPACGAKMSEGSDQE